MTKHPLALPMSQLIASDAPLLSPVSPVDAWDQLYSPTFPFNYYSLPSPPDSIDDSPIPTSRMLKMRMTPDSDNCIPTHQVFDFPEYEHPPTPSSPVLSDKPAPPKRAASPAPPAPKKPRGSAERISSKDYVPPDVSGLSKREARLIKNRAAAFLSRQRKREEFECMEVRVAELEQENARLLALTKSKTAREHSPPPPPPALLSEIEQLRAKLAAAEAREQELAASLAQSAPVKLETPDSQFLLSQHPRAPTVPAPHKSGASLGLMVLLCALPSLLALPSHSGSGPLPTTFSLPTVLPVSSPFDFAAYSPGEYDWARNPAPVMDLDIDDQGRIAPAPSTSTRTLAFPDIDALDVSFDAAPVDGGAIRVRIHPSSSSSSAHLDPTSSSSSLSMWAGPAFSAPDPFLGVGAQPSSLAAYDTFGGYGYGYEYGASSSGSSSGEFAGLRRRVRIALKSMPRAGGEGGEWEVQFC